MSTTTYKKFCVIMFETLPPGRSHESDHECIPTSWILCDHKNNRVTVAYPSEMNPRNSVRLRTGKPPSNGWPLYSALVKWHFDSYNQWQEMQSVVMVSYLQDTLSPRNPENPNHQQNVTRNQKGVTSTVTTYGVEKSKVSTPLIEERRQVSSSPTATPTPKRQLPSPMSVGKNNNKLHKRNTPQGEPSHPNTIDIDNDNSESVDLVVTPSLNGFFNVSNSSMSHENEVVVLPSVHDVINSMNRPSSNIGERIIIPLLREFSKSCEQINLMVKNILEELDKQNIEEE